VNRLPSIKGVDERNLAIDSTMSADKAPDANLRAVVFAVFAGKKERADERTRTADLLQLREIIQVLQTFAGVCTGLQMAHIKARFSSPACWVLHRIALAVVSEWCQKGRGLRAANYFSGRS
jgi:hypothetical protein